MLIRMYYYPVDTVASTVDSTKKAVESTVDGGKRYIDSAKGKFLIIRAIINKIII